MGRLLQVVMKLFVQVFRFGNIQILVLQVFWFVVKLLQFGKLLQIFGLASLMQFKLVCCLAGRFYGLAGCCSFGTGVHFCKLVIGWL